MSLGFEALLPLFVGPIGSLLVALLVIVIVLTIARLVFSLAWRLLVVGAVVLGGLWLLGVVGAGPPAV